MPQSVPIILSDGTNSHTFNPSGEDNGVHKFTSRDANGIPIGDATLSISLRRTQSYFKVRMRLLRPVVANETLNGVSTPKRIRDNSVDMEFSFNASSNTTERVELLSLVKSALADSDIEDVVTDLEEFF